MGYSFQIGQRVNIQTIMTSEKFCLRWNDFERNVSQSFTKLRKESNLFDVTLVSDDQKQVTAHKLVLSACSDFFKNIFNSNTHSHPLIYLDGVGASELNLVLDYIYQGEVQIYQEKLDRFLEIAKKLKLDGLLATDDGPQEDFAEKIEPELSQDYQTEEAHVEPPKVQKQKTLIIKERALKVLSESFEASASEVDSKFQELVVQEEDKNYRCTVCEKRMSHKTNMKKHLETHMTGLSYDCQHCGKTFRSSNSRNNHLTVYHNK